MNVKRFVVLKMEYGWVVFDSFECIALRQSAITASVTWFTEYLDEATQYNSEELAQAKARKIENLTNWWNTQ